MSRPLTTPKQRKYVRNRLAGATKKEAARDAGYSERTALNAKDRIEDKAAVRELFLQLLKKAGARPFFKKTQKKFLKALSKSGRIEKAAAATGVTRGTYYHWVDSSPEFARAAREIRDRAKPEPRRFLGLKNTGRPRGSGSIIKTAKGYAIDWRDHGERRREHLVGASEREAAERLIERVRTTRQTVGPVRHYGRIPTVEELLNPNPPKQEMPSGRKRSHATGTVRRCANSYRIYWMDIYGRKLGENVGQVSLAEAYRLAEERSLPLIEFRRKKQQAIRDAIAAVTPQLADVPLDLSERGIKHRAALQAGKSVLEYCRIMKQSGMPWKGPGEFSDYPAAYTSGNAKAAAWVRKEKSRAAMNRWS